MPEILDDITYLSRDIGPRPAGTEEEQQAALYITEQFQKSAGLSATIEDFKCASNSDVPMILCFGITFIATVISLFVSAFAIPAIVLVAVSALLYGLELVDKPLLSRFFLRGISQNVVAKYEPGYSADSKGARRRKIIVLAHYDSGKAMPEMLPPVLAALPVLNHVYVFALIAVPFLLIIRYVFFLHAVGAVAIAFNVATIIALAVIALPLITAFLHKIASYNEAANCNASGVAVMMEVARRVGNGRVSAAELATREEGEATIHGEAAARKAGLVPGGAELVYEAAQVQAPQPHPQTEAERLAAAKAAIAALTGVPVREQPAGDISRHLVQVKEPALPVLAPEERHELVEETREAFTGALSPEVTALENAAPVEADAVAGAIASAAAVSSAAVPRANDGAAAADNVPDWYKKAQASAKKEKKQPKAQRSRYADVLDAAMAESSTHFNQANRALDEQTEERLRHLQDDIREVKPPQTPAAPAPVAENPQAAAAPVAENLPAVSAPSGRENRPTQAATRTEMPVSAEATVAMAPLDARILRPAQASVVAVQEIPTPAVQEVSPVDQVPATQSRVPQLVPAAVQPAPMQREELRPEPMASKPARRPIVLPDVDMATTALPPIADVAKQRAPLAEATTSGKTAAKSLLASMVPEVSLGGAPAAASNEASAPKIKPLDLPSLSGALNMPEQPAGAQVSEAATVSATGSFAAVSATGSFAPVGDALIADVAPEDIYIDDADDSDYDGNTTEMGAYAGTGYVDMPKSRAHKFFDRFSRKKKKKDEEITPQEWLEVDDDFDAQSVGAARGGWDSFQEESAEGDAFEQGEAQWQSGSLPEMDTPLPANSPVARRGRFDGALGSLPALDDVGEDDAFAFEDDDESRKWNGGAFSRGRVDDAEEEFGIEGEYLPSEQGSQAALEEEFKQIYQFKNPDINTEVWFVSLGSELAGNAGMYAFLREHAQELKGSVFINLEALGAGTLSYIEKEGSLKKFKASSRMKRYIKKASQASGVSVETAQIGWKESAASVALKHGAQAMSLVGMEGKKPAFYGQGDDVLENLDEETLQHNADFVMEMLKNI
ncbi:MAG: M28 family peptidase [Raoultibacter sp.]